jgi:hypothetical protein
VTLILSCRGGEYNTECVHTETFDNTCRGLYGVFINLHDNGSQEHGVETTYPQHFYMVAWQPADDGMCINKFMRYGLGMWPRDVIQ